MEYFSKAVFVKFVVKIQRPILHENKENQLFFSLKATKFEKRAFSNVKEDLVMKKALKMSSLVTVGIGASAAMWLANKPNRIKAKTLLREWKRKVTPNSIF